MGALARRAWIGLVGLALALPLLATASSTPAVAATSDPAPVTIPPVYLQQVLDWQPCDFSLYVQDLAPGAPETDCATVVVPMDWRQPQAHPDITIAIALSRATGRSKGLLSFNPGGPGLPALDTPAFSAAAHPRLFRDYDLLGMDPRGYGQSQSAICPTSATALDALPTVRDARVRNVSSHRAEVAAAKLEAASCGRRELNAFVSTQQTVDDLEFVRRYLSEHRRAGAPSYDKLNYVGYSYGTWLGAWYADTYPEHTGRFVLDSNMNWTSTMYGNQLTDSFSFERRRDKMFFPWVARHDATYHLGKTPGRVKRTYERTRAGVLRSFRAGLSPVSAQDLDVELLSELYRDDAFPEGAETMRTYRDLAAGTSGRAAGARRTPADAQGPVRKAGTIELEGFNLVRCNDTAYPRDISAVLKRSDSDARRYPFTGYWNTVSSCNYWSSPAAPRRIDLAGAPRILMLQSEGDPATAYEGARAAHRTTAEHTRLVSVDDEGQHGIYLSGVSTCADRITDAFLFDGQLPGTDTRCTGRPLSRDRKVYKLDGPVDGNSVPLDAARTPRRARSAGATTAAAVALARLHARVAAQEVRSQLPVTVGR